MPLLARLPTDRPVDDCLRGDLSALAADAARHGLSAWVVDGLAARKLELGPAQGRLLADARGMVASTAKIRRLLFSVLDAVVASGVRPILLKGYGLAVRLYTNPLGRPSSDVDILVRRDEVDRVGQALGTLGLTRFVDDSLSDVFAQHHHVAFVGKGGLVEVHFKLMSGLGIESNDEGVRSRRVSSELEGRPVDYLRPEDEFVYLASHAANHAFLRLSWLVDLQVFLKKYPHLDWATMRIVADDWGCSAGVSAALLALETALEVSLAPAARRAFLERRWRNLPNARLFSAARLTSAELAERPLGSFLLRLWLVDSPIHAVRYLASGAARALRRRLARGAA